MHIIYNTTVLLLNFTLRFNKESCFFALPDPVGKIVLYLLNQFIVDLGGTENRAFRYFLVEECLETWCNIEAVRPISNGDERVRI